MKKTVESFRDFLKHYALFGMGGMSVFLFNLVLTVILTEQFHIEDEISFAIALFIAVFLAYLYHSRITFHGMKKKQRYFFFPYYFFSAALFWTISFLMDFIVSFHYTLTITLAAIPISFLNFYVNRRFIFGK